MGAHACALAGAGSRMCGCVCVRACAYICMCYYCIVSLYVRAQFVSTRVRTCVHRCVYVRAFERKCVCVCGRLCVRECVRVRVCMCVCRTT